MKPLAAFRRASFAALFVALAAPADACTQLVPPSAAEAARWRREEIDWQAERLAKVASRAEVIFYGKVKAIQPTDGLPESLGGPLRLGWREVPAFRVWVDAEKTFKGKAPSVFSVYLGQYGNTCGLWSDFDEDEVVLVVAERRYSGGHWFGEIVGPADLPELLPALAKRGLEIPALKR
jgi:hypothetical protein